MIEFSELNFRRALSRFAAGIVQCSLPVASVEAEVSSQWILNMFTQLSNV